jgi:hypothetical protein
MREALLRSAFIHFKGIVMLLRALVVGLLLAPVIANANLLLSSAVACSGDFSVQSGAAQPSILTCTGDLTFSGASLVSDTDLSITASNDLGLYGVYVSAPSLTLASGGVLTVDPLSTLDASHIDSSAGSVTVFPQGTLVPEPSGWALMLAGVAVLGAARVVKGLPVLLPPQRSC